MSVRKFFSKARSKEPGLPPGSLVHVGEKHTHTPTISILDYNQDQLREETVTVQDSAKYIDDHSVTWVTIDGVHDEELIKEVGDEFSLHPLILEDILNTNQRSKVEEYGDQVFVVARMIWHDAHGHLHSEHVSFVVAENFVLCFQERPGDIFEPLRNRIRTKSGRIRKRGTDYLLYALLDTITDHYFIVLDNIELMIQEAEEQLMSDYSEDLVSDVHQLKRELLYMQRYVLPLREVTNHMLRAEHDVFDEETLLFVRDLQDHVLQAIETIQMSRDMINSLIDLSMNQASNRMNEVMKVLTIIATIFIPLTFIAGVYGMNFQNMPELTWHNGYYFTLVLMAVVTIGMVFYFKKKNWL